MIDSASVTNIAHVIEMAVAPVFLLTGVGAIMGVLVNRLGRVVDRRRRLTEAGPEKCQQCADEIIKLARRARWIHHAITLCTLSALLVCLVIVVLFLASELHIDPAKIVSALFIAAMFALIGGLFSFLREISLATGGIESIDI
ncbi:DUF2721 domain-containing protein [Rhodocyclus tenuis]|uniref:DUF2721 domain-containing protein n=2 Tax=Rhodocyclus TaxID=1064 RepID=A0A6L5JVD0_RHOTE|nr:DUF2721 domain-containing protein [Rhodocyclus gracilis]MQY50510.1 DUF2721 domain-containing protein [Rhodocyclus gracilis]NJA88014.1 DUF2721 domain-containing protein [Rhodocyclus gracilis]